VRARVCVCVVENDALHNNNKKCVLSRRIKSTLDLLLLVQILSNDGEMEHNWNK
jgi:hypothetical protein